MKVFLFERLTKTLLQEISCADYQDSARFLSNRRICQLWGVSQRTTDRALDFLKQHRILRVHDRSSYILEHGARHKAMLLNRSHQGLPLPKLDHRRRVRRRNDKTLTWRFGLIFDTRRCWVEWAAQAQLAKSRSTAELTQAEAQLCEGFLKAAREEGCQADIVMVSNNRDSRRFFETCLRRAKWDAVAFLRRTANPEPLETIRMLQQRNIPYVTAFEPCGAGHIPCVEVNNFALGSEAGHALVRSGACRFIILDIIKETYSRKARTDGALFALGSHGLAEQSLVYRLSHDPDTPIPPDFVTLLQESQQRPTGLFLLYNELLGKIGPLIEALNLKIPAHLSIVNCGGEVALLPQNLKLSFVEIDFREVGRTAFRSLCDLQRGEPLHKYTIVEPVFRAGASTERQL